MIALFVGLVALAAATGRGPSPDPVLAQVKAKRCASAKVGDIKAVDCRGPRGRRGRRGPSGVRGDAGPRGPEGLAGTNGKQGPRGVPGPKGDPCPPSNPDCKGPQGPPGTDGKDGVDGTDGTDGAPGPAGPAGPSDGYYRNFSTVCPCFNPVSITLPPGKYLITGSSLVYNSDADFQTAGLTLSTGAEKSFRLGGRDANDGELLDVQVEVYDAVTLNAQTTVKLTYGGSFIGGYGQTLSAIKVGDVHVQ